MMSIKNMKSDKKNLNYLTKYPKLFGNTYWAGFKDSGKHLDEIINNRNKFIEDYNIKKNICCSKIPKYINKEFEKYNNDYFYDHPEFYINNDNDYVIIISPYAGGEKSKEGEDEFLNNSPFTKIYPLYFIDAITYVIIIICRNNTNKWSIETRHDKL